MPYQNLPFLTLFLTPLRSTKEQNLKNRENFRISVGYPVSSNYWWCQIHCKQRVATIFHRTIADESDLIQADFAPLRQKNVENLKMAVESFPQTFGRCIGAHFFYFSIQIIDQVKKKPFRKVVTELRFLTQLSILNIRSNKYNLNFMSCILKIVHQKLHV